MCYRIVIGYLIFSFTLFSCSVDIEKVREFEEGAMLPTITYKELNGIFSEWGIKRASLKTPLMKQYSFTEEKYTEFPQGFYLERLNDSLPLKIEAIIKSGYAIYYESKELWELHHDVFIQNSKGYTLETGKLFWNQQKKEIYTTDFVTITQPSGVIHGEGLVSDESFTDYVVGKISNSILLLEETKEDNDE